MDEDDSRPATVGDIKLLIANLKKGHEAYVKAAIDTLRNEQNDNIQAEVKKAIAPFSRKVAEMDKYTRLKNLIFRGIPDTPETNRDEIGNLIEIFKAFEFDNFEMDKSIVFAVRLGQNKGNRNLKVVFNTFREKSLIRNWREELGTRGISFSNDYSEEDRAQYAKSKQLQEELKRKYGVSAQLRGKIFIVNNIKYSLEKMQEWYNEMETKDKETQISSPEEYFDQGKRKKPHNSSTENKKSKGLIKDSKFKKQLQSSQSTSVQKQ